MVLDLVSGRADDHLSDKGTYLDFANTDLHLLASHVDANGMECIPEAD